MNHEAFLPVHHKGAQTDIVASVKCNTESAARLLFETARKRLFNVNEWQQYAGKATAAFSLLDSSAVKVQRPAQEHDYFKIDIPGPGSIAGKGYDFVRVECITQKEEKDFSIALIQVRPCANPEDKSDQSIAHFFTDEATSSFIVLRKGNTVEAHVHGRNEIPNTQSDNMIDTTRNAIIGTTAAAGISSVQWKALVNGLLGKTD